MSYQRRRSSVTKGLVNQHIDRHKFFSAIIGLLLSASFYSPAGLAEPASGEAPDFTLASHRGPNMRLQEQRGDVIMLNFWASWCGPCRIEMPILDELHERFEVAGFKVIGVNVDSEPAKAERLLSELNLQFPILFDPKGDVSERYKVEAMPSTLLIDRDGQIRYRHEGYKPGYEELYRAEISELISE
ncbi:MAG: peroxiredoxin [Candidatus Pseudothioglobus sp.]|jgi:peroxiredoxin